MFLQLEDLTPNTSQFCLDDHNEAPSTDHIPTLAVNVQFLKKSLPTPWKVNGNSRVSRILKAIILEAKYEANRNFVRGRDIF